MATTFKTPGVYISEPDSFPPAIVGVDTAVPAFIGYTEKAEWKGKPLGGIPLRIGSMAEFTSRYGGRFAPRYALELASRNGPAGPNGVELNGNSYSLVAASTRFNLYDCLRLFYANGGGDCYIVSCGTYGGAADPAPVAAAALLRGIEAIRDLVGPTVLVVPESHLLPDAAAHGAVVLAMLEQCFHKQDRMALLDLWGADLLPEAGDFAGTIRRFREALAPSPPEALRYGAAYFPFLRTSLVEADDILPSQFVPPAGAPPVTKDMPGYQRLVELAVRAQSLLPPSPAMAGVYAANDTTHGVWNAPANIAIASLTAPSVDISEKQQESLSAPLEGIGINAIRTFVNRGSLVWGARTLDSNSNDSKYIQVRRTTIYVEQSVKTALASFAFATNTASTWVAVVSMIESFLHGLWSAGGLMGATPAQAYDVQCGLSSTMTSDALTEGYMIVQVTMQMVHPAAFVELVFKQQMRAGT